MKNGEKTYMDHQLWYPQPVFDLWEASYAKKVMVFFSFTYINIIVSWVGEVRVLILKQNNSLIYSTN